MTKVQIRVYFYEIKLLLEVPTIASDLKLTISLIGGVGCLRLFRVGDHLLGRDARRLDTDDTQLCCLLSSRTPVGRRLIGICK